MAYSLTQVSILYLVIIVALSWWGFKNAVGLGQTLGVAIGDALGSAIGAVLGVFVSYQLFVYARSKGMISG